jgi:exodeoxyribonuclease V gamma subunit
LIDVPIADRPVAGHTVRVELFGRTEAMSRELPGSITPVLRDKPRAKDFLAGFLDAVVLSMLPGHHGPAVYRAEILTTRIDIDPSECCRTFRGIDQEQARLFLSTLLADLLCGPHVYLLPCEAVFNYLEKKTPIASSVERMKENEFEICSSRYGPVPNFASYDPPDDAEAQQIIERRFGLYRDSGGIAG